MTSTAIRNTTLVHLPRKTPEKIRAGGLHSIQDSSITFGDIQLIAPSPATNAASQNSPTPWRNATTPRGYTCPELAPYTGRPGAMDAFNKPSRVNTTLVYRDGRSESVT